MNQNINVNTGSFENGLICIKEASTLLENAIDCLTISKNNLEDGVSINFAKANSQLNESINNCHIIIDSVKAYIDRATKTEAEILRIIESTAINTVVSSDNAFVELAANNPDDDVDWTDEELAKLQLMFAFENGEEMDVDTLKTLIENCDVLKPKDKEYMLNQLALGNVRPAMQRIIVRLVEEDLEAVKAENQPKIDQLCEELLMLPPYQRNGISDEGLRRMLKYYDEHDPKKAETIREIAGDNLGITLDFWVASRKVAIDTEVQSLRREIATQEQQVNIYILSNREWEYDYYFKMIGTEEFEEKLIPYYFFSSAMEYFSEEMDHGIFIDCNDLFKLIYRGTEDKSFIKWLESDECVLENKDKLIALYYDCCNAGSSERFYLQIKEYFKKVYGFDMTSAGYISLGIVNKVQILTPDEEKVLAYIYITEGTPAANRFMDCFKQTSNMRGGLIDATSEFWAVLEASENNHGVFTAYFNGLGIGTKEWFTRVAEIGDNTGVMTREEYAITYMNSLLCATSYLMPLGSEYFDEMGFNVEAVQDLVQRVESENISYLDIAYTNGSITLDVYNQFRALYDDPRIKSFIERNKGTGLFGISHMEWLRKSYNAGVATGNMLPSIVASIATHGAFTAFGAAAYADTAAKLVALASMFAYQYSSVKAEALRSGRNLKTSRIYAVLEASGESITDTFLGYLPLVSHGVGLLKIQPGNKWWTMLGKELLSLIVVGPGMEIVQEEIQDNLYNPLMEELAYGYTDYEFNIDNFVDTAITSYISSFALQAPSEIIRTSPVIMSEIRRSTVFRYIKIGDKVCKITYGDLLECMNSETGIMSKNMLKAMLDKKLNIASNFSNLEVMRQYNEALNQLSSAGKLNGRIGAFNIIGHSYNPTQIAQINTELEGKITNLGIKIDPKGIEVLQKVYLQLKSVGLEGDMDVILAAVKNGCKITFDINKPTAFIENLFYGNSINFNPNADVNVATDVHELQHLMDKYIKLFDSLYRDSKTGDFYYNNENLSAKLRELQTKMMDPNNSIHKVIDEISNRVKTQIKNLYALELIEMFDRDIKNNHDLDIIARREEIAKKHCAEEGKVWDTLLDSEKDAYLRNAQLEIRARKLASIDNKTWDIMLETEKATYIERATEEALDYYLSQFSIKENAKYQEAVSVATNIVVKDSNIGKFVDIIYAIYEGALANSPLKKAIMSITSHQYFNAEGVTGFEGLDLRQAAAVQHIITEIRAQIQAIRTTSPAGMQVLYDTIGKEFIEFIMAAPKSQ